MIAAKLPCLLYGAGYHPEQWPEPVWREDVQLMRQAGVNLVTLGVFSWSRLQPEPETYAFGWMDRVIELLHQGGIFINLATGTAAPPAWLATLHPESLPRSGHGGI